MTIQTLTEQNTLTVQYDGDSLDGPGASSCISACSLCDENIKLLVFDYSNVQSVSDAALDSLVAFSSQQSQHDRKLVILAHTEFYDRVVARNLEQALQCFVRPTQVSVDRTAPLPLPIEDEVLMFCRVLAASVVRTLEFYSKMKVSSAEPRALSSGQSSEFLKVDLASIVTVISPHFEGSMILGFPRETFLTLIPKSKDENKKEAEPLLLDWAAEILNVSFGQFKTALNGKGYDFHPAIPAVIQGAEVELAHPNDATTAVCEISVGSGKCYVKVSKVLARSDWKFKRES